MYRNLTTLIKEAKRFGSSACMEGVHVWESDGGRSCPKAHDHCSQTVYVCSQCGQYDYGDAGGPAWNECYNSCMEKGYS